jgi:hypothetical protein
MDPDRFYRSGEKTAKSLKIRNSNIENPGPDLSFIDPVPKAQILKHL